jgi:glycosyltransferase involved in cell wall biosynthesis
LSKFRLKPNGDDMPECVTKMRVLFVFPSLEMGGAERVMCHLIRSLPRAHFEVHLAVLNGAGPLRNGLPDDVTLHDLKTLRVSRSVPALLRLLWRLRPNRVVSTGSHLNIVLGTLRPLFPPRCRLVIRESTTVLQLDQSRGGFLKHLASISYRLADAIIVQSHAAASELRDRLRVAGSRVNQIYNPVPFDQIDAAIAASMTPFASDSEYLNVVTVARLDPVKGLDRLIAAFRELAPRRPNARLWIVGEGTERPKLERLICESELQDRVYLVGFDANPWRWLKQADLFVLCSQFESLPNALLEAIACRCPVVTLDIPGGTREIMEQLGLGSRIVNRLEDWPDDWFERPAASVRQVAENLLGLEVIVEQYSRLLLAENGQVSSESFPPAFRQIERPAA